MEQIANIPWYFNWSFWAVAISVIALILSQLPPLHLFLKSARLDLELYSRIHLTHKVGNPNVQLHLILSNIGGKTIRVREATIGIKRDGKDVAKLLAQNYLPNPNDSKTTVLFTPFSLKPQEEWAYILNFLNYFSRENEKKYRSAEASLKDDISKKRKLLEDKEQIVEADKEYVSTFIDMFTANFIWFPGEYEVSVSINAKPLKTSMQRKYRFTLFESDSNELMKAKDDYKFGDGIYYDSSAHTGVIVPIIEA